MPMFDLGLHVLELRYANEKHSFGRLFSWQRPCRFKAGRHAYTIQQGRVICDDIDKEATGIEDVVVMMVDLFVKPL